MSPSASLCVPSCFSCIQLFVTPPDCSLLGSSVCGILQVKILEWVAISSSKGFSRPRDQTYVSNVSCIGSSFFTISAIWGVGGRCSFSLPPFYPLSYFIQCHSFIYFSIWYTDGSIFSALAFSLNFSLS